MAQQQKVQPLPAARRSTTAETATLACSTSLGHQGLPCMSHALSVNSLIHARHCSAPLSQSRDGCRNHYQGDATFTARMRPTRQIVLYAPCSAQGKCLDERRAVQLTSPRVLKG